jgi:hypothetical protein
MTEYAPVIEQSGWDSKHRLSIGSPENDALFDHTLNGTHNEPEEQTGAERGQPSRWSFYESLINIAIGYGVALASQLVIFPTVGIHIPFRDNLIIGGWMTLVSVARSFAVRRLFNWIHLQGWYK